MLLGFTKGKWGLSLSLPLDSLLVAAFGKDTTGALDVYLSNLSLHPKAKI